MAAPPADRRRRRNRWRCARAGSRPVRTRRRSPGRTSAAEGASRSVVVPGHAGAAECERERFAVTARVLEEHGHAEPRGRSAHSRRRRGAYAWEAASYRLRPRQPPLRLGITVDDCRGRRPPRRHCSHVPHRRRTDDALAERAQDARRPLDGIRRSSSPRFRGSQGHRPSRVRIGAIAPRRATFSAMTIPIIVGKGSRRLSLVHVVSSRPSCSKTRWIARRSLIVR